MEANQSHTAIRRIVYASTIVEADVLTILRDSRTNNGIDGISGLLAYNDTGFVQVLEGPPDSVADTFARIERDPRHTDIVVVQDTIEAQRVFGGWTMGSLPGDLSDVLENRLGQLFEDAPSAVRVAFGRVLDRGLGGEGAIRLVDRKEQVTEARRLLKRVEPGEARAEPLNVRLR